MRAAISLVGIKEFAGRLGVDPKSVTRWSGLGGPAKTRIKNASMIAKIEELCGSILSGTMRATAAPPADAASTRLAALADVLARAGSRTPGHGATRVIQQHHQRLARLEADVNSMRTIVDWIAREFGVADVGVGVNGKEANHV